MIGKMISASTLAKRNSRKETPLPACTAHQVCAAQSHNNAPRALLTLDKDQSQSRTLCKHARCGLRARVVRPTVKAPWAPDARRRCRLGQQLIVLRHRHVKPGDNVPEPAFRLGLSLAGRSLT